MQHKFRIDENSVYSGYGTDGTIDFDATYNEDNQPLNCKYEHGEWVFVPELENVEVTQEVQPLSAEEITKIRELISTK